LSKALDTIYDGIVIGAVTLQQKELIIAMQCVPRAETPKDLVGTALFLASEASAFITGQIINADGGAAHP